jgi:GNAT superfamily N-acetyltransferase
MPDLTAVIDATWPAARFDRCGPFTLRDGQGGGNRVSAATADGPASDADIDAAEAAMRAMGQRPNFRVGDSEAGLEAQLQARGYDVVDPTNAWVCPIDRLTDMPLPRVTVFTIWEPLAMMIEIWTDAGIGPERRAIMDRAKGPKTGLLARYNEKPGGTGFIAIRDGTAMVHALEIVGHQRRQGLGRWMMRGAAIWAAEHGAHSMAVLCTRANAGANALYSGLGMDPACGYHYRQLAG